MESRYEPGGRRLALGGDFYDVVEDDAGRLHLLVGDVCGHGPDEAALGVHLRVAWRTLVLAGVPDDAVLAILEDILVRERRTDGIFATVCQVVIGPQRGNASLWLAGHPVPILVEPSCRPLADEEAAGPPLGAVPGRSWERIEAALPPDWALALHSDGLIEGFEGADSRRRLGLAGLLGIIEAAQQGAPNDRILLNVVISEAERRNGGPLADDLAVLLVRHRPR